VKGLKAWPREDRPPVAIVYFAFRIMVGIGVLMLLIVAAGWWLKLRGRLFTSPGFLRTAQYAMPLGFCAVLAGWTVTEVGRQPWVVYGLMRTRDAVSPSLTAVDVGLSLAAYVLAYVVIFGGGFVLLRGLVRRGPPAAQAAQGHQEPPSRAARPLSAVTEAPLVASPTGAADGA
jgi:cytochrome d ubiquinol oxidase subunit I